MSKEDREKRKKEREEKKEERKRKRAEKQERRRMLIEIANRVYRDGDTVDALSDKVRDELEELAETKFQGDGTWLDTMWELFLKLLPYLIKLLVFI